jgi:hypothetical protein
MSEFHYINVLSILQLIIVLIKCYKHDKYHIYIYILLEYDKEMGIILEHQFKLVVVFHKQLINK